MSSDRAGLVPPPIRYPLPTLIAVVFLSVLIWRGEGVIRRTYSALTAPLKRVVNGPDYPKSARPQTFAGAIPRKVLRLRDGVPVRPYPGGQGAQTFRTRGFSDLYDVWPRSGMPTHYRVGNESLVGWVSADNVIAWDTRLVVRVAPGSIDLRNEPKASSGTPVTVTESVLPVLVWNEHAIKVAVWEAGSPWLKLARTGWISTRDLPADSWAALLTDAEIVASRRFARRAANPGEAIAGRLRAILGLMLTDQSLSDQDLIAVRTALPAPVITLVEGARPVDEALNRSDAVASWGGLSFRAVPLTALP